MRKTLWANILAIITIISAYLVGDENLQISVQKSVAPILALLNIGLRIITNQPISGIRK
jgi:hypothetical protein